MKKLLLFTAVLCAKSVMTLAQSLTVQPSMTNYLNSDYKNTTDGSISIVTLQDPIDFKISNYLTKKDNSGNIVYTKKTRIIDFVQHTDGSLIYIFNTISGGQSNSFLVRAAANGSILWTKQITSTSTIGVYKLAMNSNGQIFVAVAKSTNISSTGYTDTAIMGFDLNGQNNFTTNFVDPILNVYNTFSKIVIAQNGDMVGLLKISGNLNSSKCGIGLIRMTPTGTVTVSQYWDFLPDFTHLSINGLVETPAGDFIFGARLLDSQLSSNTDKMWMCKTNGSGIEMLQRTFSTGTNSGEKLIGLVYTNSSLYSFIHISRNLTYPVNEINLTVIAEINPDSLHIINSVALDIDQIDDDPYGDGRTAFGLAHNGNLVAINGKYCAATNRYMPFQMEVSPTLLSSCSASERTVVFTDSLTTYPNIALTHSGSFSLNIIAGADTTILIDIAAFPEQDLCLGCEDITQTSEETASSGLVTYPNPVSKNLHFTEPNAQNKGKYNIVAHSVFGQKVFESTNMEMPISIDVSDFTNGFYIFTLTNLQNHQQTQQRVIKN